MEDRYWDKFTRTGMVTDYLYYKGMDICRHVMDRCEADTAPTDGTCGVRQTGGRISESDYGDRHGASRISYR
ncbi:hypothetical protein [[Clostridium] hylemonae]|mgnify:CR=1 FL=1|uniref:Uncharacterized protein n=1 Tax=[Clostridium] hylemonae DSM 15053 TaxID=553973 RepID=C0C4Q7_9FIRM|nr:hypothetical protein [[Clostridium] hylemonae]EEG73050.1 hypothetical protein CLOHYLEM_07073 [[Clostridium] hylemonae DSM 15053]QEK16207.1 hypothetical protein LAJLEIBI_00187 [[Clostridium] hylemonae DSM 15053]BDF03651.1 hypothetical protein CE91St63_07130 [[Clostridium] hylemonae]